MQRKLYKLECIEDARKLENATHDALTRLGFSYRNKNELFNKLLDKHGIYSESQKKMEQFAIGSDENSQSLVLKDAKGNQFSTGNPIVLKEVIELVRAQIKMQCGQVEEEILNFVV